MKELNEYTKKEFMEMENFYEEGTTFSSVVIVPVNDIHDSGYRCMKFILVNHGTIVGAVSGWSDVLHLNGIGGYGIDYKTTIKTQKTNRVAWSIDCLKKSRCLRLFADKQLILPYTPVSSAEVFAIAKGY